MPAGRLTNLVVVVTGASGGIGRAMAGRLAEAGARLVLHGHRSVDGLRQTAQAAREYGADCLELLADLGQTEGQHRLVEQAWDWQGRVDVWINNAGVDTLTGPAAGWNFEQKLAALWQVDVQGTITLSRAAGQRMRAQGAGVILNTGWDQAAHGMAGDSGELFATAKGAIMAFSKSLALSLAPQVRVNCLAPGWIRTAWGQAASESWQERARQESLLRRWGQADDVARAAVFLASAEAAYLTGQVLEINGGFNWHALRGAGLGQPPPP